MRRILLTVAAVGVLTLALAACEDTQSGDATTSPSAPATTGTTGATASPSDGLVTGEAVTVQGTVSMSIADRAFLLTDPSLVEGTASDLGSDLVVIAPSGASVAEGDQVVVHGTLEQASVGDELSRIEDELNVDLPSGIASVIGDTKLLLADSVEAA